MSTYTPTSNWSGIQKRTIDPKSKLDSDILNHLTVIGGGDRYKVSGLDMDILYDTDNKVYFHLTPGIVVKDYVVLEFTADMYILAGTWPFNDGVYYLAVEYQYVKQYPPVVARIVFIPETQLNGLEHYALFKITKTGNVFPTDLAYEQLAFSDEELAQPVFVERLAKKYVMTALGGETTLDISLYFDEYVKEYALYRNGLLQLEGYDFILDPTTKIITMTEPLDAGDIMIFLSKMWGFANSELEEFGTYTIYDLDNGALDSRYYTRPQIDNFFEGTSTDGKKQVDWDNVLNKPQLFLDLTNVALKSDSVNQFFDLNSDGYQIDMAVSKMHDQNTDTGTNNTSFYIGTNGVLLKNVSGSLELKSYDDSNYADLTVNNLTVKGTQTIINSEVVSIADNILVLNSNYSGSTPTENAGIEVNRGSVTQSSLIWNETIDKWQAGLFGDEKTIVLQGNTITLIGDVVGGASFDASGNMSITTTVVDASHNHTIDNINGLQAILDSKMDTSTFGASTILNLLLTVDGSDSGLDADLLDGYHASLINIANTIPVRDTSGSINANASSASKLNTAREIRLSGDVSGAVNFDGSSNVNITVTVADNSHNHIIDNITNLQSILDSKLDSADFTPQELLDRIKTVDGSDSGLDADLLDGYEGSFYRDASNINAGILSPSRLSGTYDINISGTASSANMLTNSRTIELNGDVTGSVQFDGSSNVTIITEVLDNSHNHTMDNITGLAEQLDLKLDASQFTALQLLMMISTVDGSDSGLDADLLDGRDSSFYTDASHLDTGIISPPRLSGTYNIDITGSAAYLETPRNITLSGDVTGSAQFDGSADASIATNVSIDNILTKLKTVDGTGSGLDADLLDGFDSTAFVKVVDFHPYTLTYSTTANVNAGSYWEYDTWLTFGTDTDARSRIVDVKILDSVSGSVTQNMWINSEAVATVAIRDNRYVRVINNHTSTISFYITIK
jgi:hypothetical protein